MNKIDIPEPDKFEIASIVIKNSRTGFSSNKRLLAIRKGNLYYYSNIPKQFKGDPKILDSIHELPKCSIQIVNIKQIKGYQSTSSYFSIQFQAKHMLQRQDIRKTMTLEEFNFAPKNTKQIITWQFTCDNQFIKQRWVAALETLQIFYTKEKKDIQKYFNDHQSDKKSQSSGGGRNSTKIPWRDSQVFKKTDSQVNYLKIIGADSKQKQPNMSRSNSPTRSIQNSNLLNPSNLKVNQIKNQNYNKDLDQQNRIRLSSATNQMKNFSPQQINILSPRLDNKSNSQNTKEVTNISINEFIKNIKEQNKAKSLNSSNLKLEQVSEMKESITKSIFSQNNKLEEKKLQKSMQLTASQRVIIQQVQNDQGSVQSAHQTPFKKFQSDSELSLNDQEALQNDLSYKGSQEVRTNLFQPFNSGQKKQSKIAVLVPSINIPQSNKGLKNEIMQIRQVQSKRGIDKKLSINRKVSNNHQQIQLKQKNFYSLHSQIFSKRHKFSTKLQIQKQFYHLIYQFKQKATKNFIQLVEGFSNFQYDSQKYQIENRTNNGMKIHFENTYFKICFATTQNLIISQKEKIFFNQENIKNLKRQFKIYQDLWKKVILHELKNNNNQSLKLRVPLVVYLEYKGVVCLAMEEGLKQTVTQSSGGNIDSRNKNFITQKSILQDHGYDLTQFIFKQVEGQQYLIINIKEKIKTNGASDQQSLRKDYLHSILKVKRNQKNHNMSFDPPFNQKIIIKAKQEQSSTSLQTFQKYIKTLTALKNFKGICPKQQIIQILEYCHFCKKLRKLYRSAQGEINQLHFLNLILKKDQNMMTFLTQGGCENIPIIKGILFSFIRYYLGISCQVNAEYFEQADTANSTPYLQKKVSNNKKTDLILSAHAIPLIKVYSLQKLELFEAFQSFDRYLQDGNGQLAKQALQIKKSVIWTNSTSFQTQNLLIISHDNAKMAYSQNDFTSCIKYCRQYAQEIQNNSPHLFFIYLLMMKAYSQISSIELTEVFQKTCDLLKFNYGPHNSNFISLYCVVSYYYIKLSNHTNKSKQSEDLFLIGQKILSEAGGLCLQLFGQNSSQYADILVDLSRINQKRKSVKSLQNLEKAKFIVKSLEDKEKILDLNIYEMKFYLNQGEIQKCQKALDILIQKLDSKISNKTLTQIFRFQYDLGQFSQKQMYIRQAIQNLWAIQTQQSKQMAIQLALKYSLKQNRINIQSLLQNFSNGSQIGGSERSIDNFLMFGGHVNKAKAFLLIQQNIQDHDGLLQMIRESFQEKEEALIKAFWTIGGKKRMTSQNGAIRNFDKFQ